MKTPRIVGAMEYVDDDLISATEGNTQNKKQSVWNKWGGFAACFCLVIAISVIIIPHILNDDGSVNKPQYIYQVGETNTTSYGTIEYLGFNNNTISARIQSSKEWNFTFYIEAYNKAGDTEGERDRYIATTNASLEFGDVILLKDVLVIDIDGKDANDLIIPADGMMHNITIDYSYLVDNNYEVEYSWCMNEFGRFSLYTAIAENLQVDNRIYGSVPFDIDNDGLIEDCSMTHGPTSGLLTVVFTVSYEGNVKYKNTFNLNFDHTLSFAEKDGVTQIVKDGKYHRFYVDNNRIVIDDLDAEYEGYWGGADWNLDLK